MSEVGAGDQANANPSLSKGGGTAWDRSSDILLKLVSGNRECELFQPSAFPYPRHDICVVCIVDAAVAPASTQ